MGDKSDDLAMLDNLASEVKRVGYMPNIKFVIHDIKEEDKEAILFWHSKKLDIGFGLINTPPNTIIRITKNLHDLGDCHIFKHFHFGKKTNHI